MRKKTRKLEQFEEYCSKYGIEETIFRMCLDYELTSQELYKKIIPSGNIKTDSVQYFLEVSFDEIKVSVLKDYFQNYINSENNITSCFQLYFLDEYALKYATIDEMELYYKKIEKEDSYYHKYLKSNRVYNKRNANEDHMARLIEYMVSIFSTLSNQEKEAYLNKMVTKLNGGCEFTKSKKYVIRDLENMIRNYIEKAPMPKKEKNQLELSLLSYESYLTSKKEIKAFDRGFVTNELIKNETSALSRIRKYLNGDLTLEEVISLRKEQLDSYLLHFPEDKEKVEKLRSDLTNRKNEINIQKREAEVQNYKNQKVEEFKKIAPEFKFILEEYVENDKMTLVELGEKYNLSRHQLAEYREFMKEIDPEFSEKFEKIVNSRIGKQRTNARKVLSTLYYMIKKPIPSTNGTRSFDIIDFYSLFNMSVKDALRLQNAEVNKGILETCKIFFEDVWMVNLEPLETTTDDIIARKLQQHNIPVNKVTYEKLLERYETFEEDYQIAYAYKEGILPQITELLIRDFRKPTNEEREKQKTLGTR